MLRPGDTLKELFGFMLGVKTIEGTLVERRIENLCAEMFVNLDIDSQHLNQNVSMFTVEQLEFIKEELCDFLYFFNYTDHPLESDPNTTFLLYNGEVQHDQDKLISLFNGYLVGNETALRNAHSNYSLQSFEFDENDAAILPSI